MNRLFLVKKYFYYILYCVLLLALISGFIYSIVYDYNRQSTINKINKIYNDQVTLNTKLKNDYNYYSTDLYIQKEASDNLGLSAKNSTLVIIPTQPVIKSNTISNNAQSNRGINAWLNLIKSRL